MTQTVEEINARQQVKVIFEVSHGGIFKTLKKSIFWRTFLIFLLLALQADPLFYLKFFFGSPRARGSSRGAPAAHQ